MVNILDKVHTPGGGCIHYSNALTEAEVEAEVVRQLYDNLVISLTWHNFSTPNEAMEHKELPQHWHCLPELLTK
ncbi:hypothetical protein ACLKA7_009132 [Drosophila subpalustris]